MRVLNAMASSHHISSGIRPVALVGSLSVRDSSIGSMKRPSVAQPITARLAHRSNPTGGCERLATIASADQRKYADRQQQP